MNSLRYKEFDFGAEDERIEECFEETLSTLRTMYPDCTMFHSDMYGIDVLDAYNNRVAQYSTGYLSDGRLAMQKIGA
ncbi:MAG: hypothetical protein K6F33_10690 [Bacteroidales bacterium]|nr:hypothetical protein [Bacteroidales bacterium]